MVRDQVEIFCGPPIEEVGKVGNDSNETFETEYKCLFIFITIDEASFKFNMW